MTHQVTSRLPHPVYSKPIETVEELQIHVEKLNISVNAETLTDLIRDSYDVHAEKPARKAIKNLVHAYLLQSVFANAYSEKKQGDLTADLAQSAMLGEGHFFSIRNEFLKKNPDKTRINNALKMLDNEVETIRKHFAC